MTLPPLDPVQASLSGAYRIERELGGGGMSRVFVATDPVLGRQVVVKVLSPELAQELSAERFAREIKLAAALQDPHIVPLLSAGMTDAVPGQPAGLPYFTMPFVAGESLRARLLRGDVPLDEGLRILRDVAEALEYAHARGVVHRDIKPENILLAGRNAVVADFGIAKALSAARSGPTGPAGATLTSVGTSLGTPAYMAPEQVVGDAADHRADLYAWGVVAYELLAGRHPFAHRTTPQQLVAAHLTEIPRRIDEVRPGLSPSLAVLVMRCLAKDANARPADAAEILAALATIASTGSQVPIARTPRARPWLAVIVAALVVFAVGAALLARRSASGGAADRRNSLAVLPFEHQGDSADAYLTDGITDEIRGRLTGIHDLVVIARASSNQYRTTKKSPREITRELGVRYLLTGTVRVVGHGGDRRVLVRPELVEVSDDGLPQNRWQQPFDAPVTDVIHVQSDIAGQVVSAMEVAVVNTDQAKLVQLSTRDPIAYDFYLRGRAAVNWGANNDVASQLAAIPLYEQAVARDSTLIDAWTALAVSRALAFSNGTPSARLAEEARTAAERAAALDANGARGHRALGAYYRLVVRDVTRALAENEAAYRAAPGDVVMSTGLGFILEDLGRYAEALRLFIESERLDPRNAVTKTGKATLLLSLGRIPEARTAIAEAVALAPTSMLMVSRRIAIELAAGDVPAARRVLAAAGQDIPPGRLWPFIALSGNSWLFDGPDQQKILSLDPEAYGGDRATWALVRARTAWWSGDSLKRRAWGDSAVRYLQAQARDVPDDAPTQGDLAEAFAHAGRRAESERAAETALALTRSQSGGRGRVYAGMLWNCALAASMAGSADSAVAWLAEARSLTAAYSSARMRVEPWLVPLRGDPRFERLVGAR